MLDRYCIDPGHGGPDPGALGPGGEKEADINLLVAKKLRKQLESSGAEVFMTRQSDIHTKLDLYDRAKFSNQHGAGVFVSLHCNASKGKQAHGIEVWHYGTKESTRLAELVYGNIVSLGSQARGVKVGQFAVLKHTQATAVLVEMGFITNPGDLLLLKSQDYQQSMATSIARALRTYMTTRKGL